jgi:flagellar biosynthesis/type III secretory pathway protein FliH
MDRGVYKRCGRFIKRTDDIIPTLSLRPFSFDNLCEVDQLLTDNPGRNLIFTKFHSKKDLRTSIQEHPGMGKELREPNAIPPILQPIDFTVDWRRQQERATKKAKGRTEEDEEYDIEFEQMVLERQMNSGSQKAHKSKDPKEADDKQTKAPQAKQIASLTDLEASGSKLGEDVFNPAKTELAAGDHLLKSEISTTEVPSRNPLKITKLEESAAEVAPSVVPSPSQSSATSAEVQPKPSSVLSANTPVFEPEQDAMRSYREVLSNPDLSPDNIRAQIEAAKSQGYQDGFRQGEEKATLQLQGLAKQVVENVESILQELGGLRGQILIGAEQNFKEVCQALAEALIEREIQVSPQAFKTIVDRIVTESISQDQFKILVHPELYTVLKSANLDRISDRLFEDQSVEKGQFRIESSQAIIDGNIKQVIADLLSQADLHILEDTHNKAG